MDDARRRRLGRLAALVPILVFFGWRVAACPLDLLWRDGAAVLSLFAAFLVVAPDSRARQPVTIGVMMLLLAAYGAIQVPMALDFLRQAW